MVYALVLTGFSGFGVLGVGGVSGGLRFWGG